MTVKYLSDKDLAYRYGVHRTTIWDWVHTLEFPSPVRFGPRCTRWSQSAIEAWESKQREG